jgi:hypothetical protein
LGAGAEKGEFVIDDIEYDEKNSRVIVSGPFDADKLADKLCCKACNIIKEIEIVEPAKKEEPEPQGPEDKVKDATLLGVEGGGMAQVVENGITEWRCSVENGATSAI